MSEKVFAYLVTSMLVESKPLDRIPDDFVPSISVNDILLHDKDWGRRTVPVSEPDGKVASIQLNYDMICVATGEREGDVITFGLGEQRLLNLLSLAVNGEAILTAQVHEFADKVKERAEEILSKPPSSDTAGDVLRAVDEIERHFWTRKR